MSYEDSESDTFDYTTPKDRILQMFEKECFTDVSFAIGIGPDVEILKAHKAILSSGSPVFATMFFGSLPGSTATAIKIPDRPDIFELMLKYLYVNTADIRSCTHARLLYESADKYIIPGLKNDCIEYLVKKLRPSNAIIIHQFAKFFNENNLKEKALEIIREQTISVLHSSDFDLYGGYVMMTILEQNKLQTTEIELFETLVSNFGIHNEREDNVLPDSVSIYFINEKFVDMEGELSEAYQNIQYHTMTTEQFINGPAVSDCIYDEDVKNIIAYLNRPKLFKNLYPKNYVQNLRPKKNLPHVFFDINIDGSYIGRLIIQLRSDVVPKTIEKILPFFRGDNINDWRGSIRATTRRLACEVNSPKLLIEKENSILNNLRPGCVFLAYHSKTNQQCISSHFFIALQSFENNKGVGIGRIVNGMNVVDIIASLKNESAKIENLGEIKA